MKIIIFGAFVSCDITSTSWRHSAKIDKILLFWNCIYYTDQRLRCDTTKQNERNDKVQTYKIIDEIIVFFLFLSDQHN